MTTTMTMTMTMRMTFNNQIEWSRGGRGVCRIDKAKDNVNDGFKDEIKRWNEGDDDNCNGKDTNYNT